MTRRFLSRGALAGAGAAALATSCLVAPPAHALFGLGDVVYDPANYAQNVLTAVRSLEQINNQIRQIQNQATSLLNEAKNLESLPVSTLADLKAQVEQTQALLAQAQRVAFNVQAVQQAFSERYKGTALTASQNANGRACRGPLAGQCRSLRGCAAGPSRRRRQHRAFPYLRNKNTVSPKTHFFRPEKHGFSDC